jgi:hypothetical protein
MANFTITGRITDSQDGPASGLIVRAFIRSREIPERPIGNPATTDSDGRFRIEIAADDDRRLEGAGREAELFIRVFDGERLLAESDRGHPVESPGVFNLRLEATRDRRDEPWLRVYGTVRDAFGDLLDGVTVQAVDRDLRNEQVLGTMGSRGGQYDLRYQRSQFRRAEKDSADLVIKILDAQQRELYRTPIHYNAPAELELHVKIDGGEYKGPSEWEALTSLLMPLLDGVTPADLRENDQYQDVSFLADETDRSRVAIAVWIACFRVSERALRLEATLTPEAIFAFLRQDQPLAFSDSVLREMQDPDRAALLEDNILRGLALLVEPLPRSLLEKAIADGIVSPRIGQAIAEIVSVLARLRVRDVEQTTFGGGKGTLGQLLQITLPRPEDRTAFLAAFTAHTGPLTTFWKNLEREHVLRPEDIRRARLGFDVGALTRNHVPLVAALVERFARGDLKAKRELATFSRTEWTRLFAQPGPDGQPIGVPANIDGATEEEKREQYAAILQQQFQRAYPTTAFAATLARTEQTPLRARTGVSRFLLNNPTFHLDRVRIDQYLNAHAGALNGITDKDAVLRDLNTVQRVFKLHPSYRVAETLLSRKIDSAQQIYFMGRGQFMSAMSAAGLNKIEARKIYRRAENAYAMALTMFSEYNRQMNGLSPYAVPEYALDQTTEAAIAALPNLASLFGSLDYCECTHCRSVYSPAAYFVDVMRFLGERGTNGTTVNAGKNVRQVLLERRPDLGEIELSCENTNTPLPYIDLVNEILEDVVAPPTPVTLSSAIEVDLVAGPIKASVLTELGAKSVAIGADALTYAPDSRGQWAVRDGQQAYRIFKTGGTLRLLPTRQTFLSAAELRANPEYTNADAYTTLSQEVFPLKLPFDLWYLQARTYLAHLGVPQPRLLELFQQKLADGVTLSPTTLQIDVAWLGLTETERAILNGSLAGPQPWEFWGLAQNANNLANPNTPSDPTANITGSWITVLSSVDLMLHHSGLEYKELLQLLDMRYVNPTGSIFIFDTADPNASNCDTSLFTIRNLTEDALNRIHRFSRLWRKLGCAMWELDILLPDVSPAPGLVDKRITDAALQDISRMSRLREETGLDWRSVHSLYNGIDHNAYVDRAKDSAPIQTLYERLFRNRLVDAVASFPPRPDLVGGTIDAAVPGILAAFRIKEADLDLILADLGLAKTAALDATVLGRIYRVAALAKAFSLTVDQWLRLKRLSAQDPFADPAATRAFLELARRIADSDFSIVELDYLLAHRFPPNAGVAFEDKAIVLVLQALREGLQKISDDVRLKTEEAKDAYVRSKLGLLPALTKDADQVIALSIIDGTWEGTVATRNALIDTLFAGVLDLTVAKATLAVIAPALSPAVHQAAVDVRFAYVQPELEAFLVRIHQEAFVAQKTAEVLQLDVPSATALLLGLRLAGSTKSLLNHIDDPRLIDRLPDGTYQFALDEASFPRIFESLRLLHKDALTIAKLDMKADDVVWWLEGTHAADLGWMHPNEFPIDTTTQVAIGKWVAIHQVFSWKRGLPKSDLTAFQWVDRVLDAATSSADNVDDLVTLTGWEAADIKALAEAFHWVDAGAAFDEIKKEVKKPANLLRVADAMKALRQLGVNATRAIEWATPAPDAADAESLKQTVKAKYDLPQWRQVIQPIQDVFREQKRQALVSWLIAHPNQAKGQNWIDTNGLYSSFLIDVEMSACMLTSRLKQAAGSAQLFVQRCLLNLEVDILAKADLDPKWKQWKWMKRYRVWEANRKVFLYPENWIEPELRDEKSPFFKELETELLQNDVTQDTAEQAFMNYLEKLDGVANLEIRAMCHQVLSADESVLHVFGRTRSSETPEYFYRRRINGGRWTPWEKGPDINANLLVTSVFNRRLHLFWPQLLEKADPPRSTSTPNAGQSDTAIPQPDSFWELRLFRSELKAGKWMPKRLSDKYVVLRQSEVGAQDIALRAIHAPNLAVQVFESGSRDYAPANRFDFDVIGSQVEKVRARDVMDVKKVTETSSGGVTTHKEESSLQAWRIRVSPDSQIFDGLIMNRGQQVYHNYSLQYLTSTKKTVKVTKPGFTNIAVNITLPTATDATNSVLLLKAAVPNSFTVVDSYNRSFTLERDDQLFFWDRFRTYFVAYTGGVQRSYYGGSWHMRPTSWFRFYIHYHPFVELFIKELNAWGIKGLLNRRLQIDPASVPGSAAPFTFAAYNPGPRVVKPGPVEDVDFTYTGAYAPYNWELFFHAPFFIANRLAANQRFEESLKWYHYVFDPTSTDTASVAPDTPQQKFWITKPFFETTKADYYKQKIENIMMAIAKGDAQLREQVNEWRNNPFNPHLIARMRTVAYQKNVLSKYVQTLIAWGDQLFRQDTIETLNEATQLYILAASVLGPRPKSIPRKVANPVKTFYQLQQEGIDVFGNVLKAVENLLPPMPPSGGQDDDTPELPHLDVLYFCIPNNENLLTLWDTVADRLFKIRHCMNIEGVVRQLPLFEPPIDPGLLVKAAAAGLDIGAVMNDMNAPLPLYRFTTTVQHALEVCGELRALGSAMLTALEKRDAEGFALLRSSHELMMLDRVRLVKAAQVAEATRTFESMQESRKVVEVRRKYYEDLKNGGLNPWEATSLVLTGGAIVAEIVATVLSGIAAGTSLIPQFSAGAAGFGGSPVFVVTTGGSNVSGGLSNAANVVKSVANILQMASNMTSTIGGYNRRAEEWNFQTRLAKAELPQVDKQIAAADLRRQIAEQELKNHDTQRENSDIEDEYMRTTKFTNDELYEWMIGQLSTVYFQSYQLAYDLAKRAERCLRYELGLSDSSYIQFGYWDSLKKGLLAGDRLFFDLKRLEGAYYEQSRREYELVKHISLAQLDPIALLKLRQNGDCFVDIPETVFDMDYPGHYFRRLKTVGLSIPCTAGPYTTIACTLTLTSNHLRTSSQLLGGKYPRDTTIEDPRFRDEVAAIQSIATSGAQNDHGMFELNFRDERYLPFEGAGAVSTWHIALNAAMPQFDVGTITDVIMHVNYTARAGGELLRSKAAEDFNETMNELALAENRRGLYRIIDLKREYSAKWYRFLHPANPADDQALMMDDLPDRLPYFTRGFPTKKVRALEVVALMKDGAAYQVQLSPLGTTPADLLSLGPDPMYTGLQRVAKDLTGSEINFTPWTLKLRAASAGDFKSLPADAVEELFLVANYTIA